MVWNQSDKPKLQADLHRQLFGCVRKNIYYFYLAVYFAGQAAELYFYLGQPENIP